MEIRGIRPGEEAEVSSVYALSWKAAYRGIAPDKYLDELPLDSWVSMLKEPGERQSFVAEVDGVIVATACVAAAQDEEEPGWGELISCYVLPEHWGKGIGGALLAVATDALKRQGLSKIYLWVLEQNARARAFYEKHGFHLSNKVLDVDIGGQKLATLQYRR